MRSEKTISIAHLSPVLRDTYALHALVRLWRDQGCKVVIDTAYAEDADVCILHQDLTRLDPAHIPPAPARASHVNGRVLDISKRTFSTLEVRPGDDWAGPVIIKTDLNNFGISERRTTRKRATAEMRRRLARISWRLARALPKRFYPILKSIDDVPAWVWRDRGYIVEKFMPESVDGLYCVRGWLFLGDQGYGYRIFSTDPLVKTGTMVRYEYFDDIPDEITAERTRLGFDFGKFDYVECAGKPILLDANKTPSYSGAGDSPRFRRLADGIRAFL